jgi:hypothetical protein
MFKAEYLARSDCQSPCFKATFGWSDGGQGYDPTGKLLTWSYVATAVLHSSSCWS